MYMYGRYKLYNIVIDTLSWIYCIIFMHIYCVNHLFYV